MNCQSFPHCYHSHLPECYCIVEDFCWQLLFLMTLQVLHQYEQLLFCNIEQSAQLNCIYCIFFPMRDKLHHYLHAYLNRTCCMQNICDCHQPQKYSNLSAYLVLLSLNLLLFYFYIIIIIQFNGTSLTHAL